MSPWLVIISNKLCIFDRIFNGFLQIFLRSRVLKEKTNLKKYFLDINKFKSALIYSTGCLGIKQCVYELHIQCFISRGINSFVLSIVVTQAEHLKHKNENIHALSPSLISPVFKDLNDTWTADVIIPEKQSYEKYDSDLTCWYNNISKCIFLLDNYSFLQNNFKKNETIYPKHQAIIISQLHSELIPKFHFSVIREKCGTLSVEKDKTPINFLSL